MGLQLIFAVESDKKSKSDWIYIKDTIDYFYRYDLAHVKLSPVYMHGKGNYKIREKEIKRLISQYASMTKTNESKVIYCFDCDDYDMKKEDADFLSEAQQYCERNGYDFAWFCKDIERVYVGRKVEDSQKTKEAASFKKKKAIGNIKADRLSVDAYQADTSNLMKILDKYLKRKK